MAVSRNAGCVKLSADELTTNFSSGPWAEKYPPIRTITQAADMLQVPIGTLRFWRMTGRLNGCSRRYGRVWYANWQEGPKQKRQSLRTRNHDVARQKARALEAQLSGAVPRQAGTFDIATVVQAYLDWQESNDRADKTMKKYRYVLNRFAAHCHAAGVRLMHAITVQRVDEFGVRRRRDGMAAKTVYTELTIVRQWLNFAVTRRMLTMSPVAGTKLVKPKPSPRDHWRQDQLDAIVDAAKGP